MCKKHFVTRQKHGRDSLMNSATSHYTLLLLWILCKIISCLEWGSQLDHAAKIQQRYKNIHLSSLEVGLVSRLLLAISSYWHVRNSAYHMQNVWEWVTWSSVTARMWQMEWWWTMGMLKNELEKSVGYVWLRSHLILGDNVACSLHLISLNPAHAYTLAKNHFVASIQLFYFVFHRLIYAS